MNIGAVTISRQGTVRHDVAWPPFAEPPIDSTPSDVDEVFALTRDLSVPWKRWERTKKGDEPVFG